MNYSAINLNQSLQPIGSPIDKGRPFTSGYSFDSQMDREFINQVALRTDSVSTRTIQDLAVTDAKIANLTANKITAGTIDASAISVINLNANNITSGTISASTIAVTNLNANNLTTGTISASTITITNLNASNISTGTLSANRIGASSIAADKLDVSQLSAISANMGTLTSGLINGGTITGALVRTASSGARVQLNGTANKLEIYNSGGTNIGYVANFSNNLGVVADAGTLVLSGTRVRVVDAGLFVDEIISDGSGTVTFNEPISSSALTTGLVVWNTRSSNPGDDWALYMYNNSGYSLRTKMSDDVWSVDQTAV